MQALVKKIARYMDYIRSLGLSISIHFSPEVTARLPYDVWQRLLPYNSHNNPYCLAVKSCSAEKCIAHQRAIQCDADVEPRQISCYAGVLEYVFPIEHGKRTVGYAAISGYLSDASAAPAQARSWLSSLRESTPKTELADTVVPPLVIMLTCLVSTSEKFEDNEQNLMSQYLAENHTSVDFDNFCRHFSRSRSYMSHKFAKIFGMSFSSYCNKLRLEDAGNLLLLTDQSISDIALNSGFGDVSYFIRLFKRYYGLSPLKYRKRAQDVHRRTEK